MSSTQYDEGYSMGREVLDSTQREERVVSVDYFITSFHMTSYVTSFNVTYEVISSHMTSNIISELRSHDL